MIRLGTVSESKSNSRRLFNSNSHAFCFAFLPNLFFSSIFPPSPIRVLYSSFSFSSSSSLLLFYLYLFFKKSFSYFVLDAWRLGGRVAVVVGVRRRLQEETTCYFFRCYDRRVWEFLLFSLLIFNKVTYWIYVYVCTKRLVSKPAFFYF